MINWTDMDGATLAALREREALWVCDRVPVAAESAAPWAIEATAKASVMSLLRRSLVALGHRPARGMELLSRQWQELHREAGAPLVMITAAEQLSPATLAALLPLVKEAHGVLLVGDLLALIAKTSKSAPFWLRAKVLVPVDRPFAAVLRAA